MSKLYNLYAAHAMTKDLYGINPTSFEEVAMTGWSLIGNKHTRLYRYVADTENQQLVLPCNADIIESVHIPIIDAQITSNKKNYVDSEAIYVENYIEHSKRIEDPFYQSGKLVKYKEADGVLYFTRDYKNVMVIYHGIVADNDTGLPLINEKELYAVAAYCAYIATLKNCMGGPAGDKYGLQKLQFMQKEWQDKCRAARVPEHLSQNDMDAILDVKSRWDRKWYGKSFQSNE